MTRFARPFEEFISPLTPSVFFGEYFEKTPLILQGGPGDRFDKILTMSGLADHIQRYASPEGIDVMQAGQPVSIENWTRPHPNLAEERLVDSDRLLALIVQGYSVRLNGLHHTIPRVRDFCSAMESDLNMAAHANLYITPAGQPALLPHYDTHDIFVLQLNGTKRWNLHDRPLENPTERQPFSGRELPTTPPSQTVLMGPGDLMYLPRGLVHSAKTEDAVSVHLALGLNAPRLADVARAAIEQLWSIPAMRHSIPHGYAEHTETEQSLHVLADAIREQTTPDMLTRRLKQVADDNQTRHLPDRRTDLRLVLSGLLQPASDKPVHQTNTVPGDDDV